MPHGINNILYVWVASGLITRPLLLFRREEGCAMEACRVLCNLIPHLSHDRYICMPRRIVIIYSCCHRCWKLKISKYFLSGKVLDVSILPRCWSWTAGRVDVIRWTSVGCFEAKKCSAQKVMPHPWRRMSIWACRKPMPDGFPIGGDSRYLFEYRSEMSKMLGLSSQQLVPERTRGGGEISTRYR